MGKWGELTSIISRIFYYDVKNEGGEQIQVCCPKCQENENLSESDGKYNLEINLRKKKFRCWKCDSPFFSGDLKALIKYSGDADDIRDYNEYVENNFDVLLDDEEKVVVEIVDLPSEYISFRDMNISNPDHIEAYNYLVRERQLNYDTIIKYNLGFCVEGRYKKRVIIPSYDATGNLNYFVARATQKWMKPPYDNFKSSKDAIIFNEGFIDWDSTVYLVEGPFDYLSFPLNTITMLGKVMGKKLFFTLMEKKPDIIVILDPDAWSNAIKLYDQIQSIYYDCLDKVKIVKLDIKAIDKTGNIVLNRNKKPVMYDLDEVKKNLGVQRVIEEIRKARQLVDDDYLCVK